VKTKLNHGKLNLYFVSIIFGYFIIFASAALADHVNQRSKGKHSPGPGQNELILKKSDTEYFGDYGDVIVKGAHVPTLLESGKNVYLYYQWFPKDDTKKRWFDHIGVSVSRDSGSTWDDAVGLVIEGIPQHILGGEGRPMDPAAVGLTSGQIRLFFTLERNQPHNKVIGDAKIHSALSKDGINFVYETGPRFQIDEVDLRDPAIVFFKNKWHLYAPNQKHSGTGYYATSTDGLNFVRQKDLSVSERGDWLGNATTVNGRIYFFGTVWVASSSNGTDWHSTRSRGLGPDPAVIHLENGNWLGVMFRRMN
jgi:hypothetical protein